MSSRRLHSTRRTAILAMSIVSVAWLAVGNSEARAETLLRWKFTAGEHLVQTFDQNMVIEMQIGDQPIEMTMQQTMTMGWRIHEVDEEGAASTTMSIDRIKMAIKSPAGEMNFDTADKDKKEGGGPLEVMAGAIKNIIGVKYNVKMSPTGEILDVSVPVETREALKKQFNSIPGMQQMGDMFTDEGIKNMASQNLQAFPEEPVSPGDTWTKEGKQDFAQLGKHTTKTTYEYLGPIDVDGRTVEQIKATMETDFEGEPAAPGMKMKIEDQKMSGVIQFDNELGRMTQSDFDIDLTMTMDFGQQSLEQHIKGKITTTITPAGDADSDADTDEDADTADDS